MSTFPSLRIFSLGAGLAALALALGTPAIAQQHYGYSAPPPAYTGQGSYGQRYDNRVVVTYGQPSPYDYGYSYGYSGSGRAPVYETEARVYAATGAVATGYSHDRYGYDRYDRYGHDGYGYDGERHYYAPRHPDRYAYRYRGRHDRHGYGHRYDRGGRYGYSRTYQGYRDEYGYQDDRPRSARRHDRYDGRYDRRYERRGRDYCDCSDVYIYDD